MPWLIKDGDLSEQLFFVHVPRCGGTSLMHHFDVPTKCKQNRSLWGKFGMRQFFNRYRRLETSNFPIWTRGNLVFLIILLATAPVLYVYHHWIAAIVMTAFPIIFIVCLSFVFTAPAIGRLAPVRRFFLIFVHYVLCQYMESIEWCTGANKHGYMMHFTAHKILKYGYVTPDVFEAVNTMAIVRSPYARMVSIYMYNRFGPAESFTHFMRTWYNIMKPYRDRREMEEWFIPCHAIPQFEYTHFEGKQLVQSIVKQEELKFLKTKEDEKFAVQQDSTVKDLPPVVRSALLGMPHTNQRITKQNWWDYYDQETLDLCYAMYKIDFEAFNYSPKLEQRPDLKSPAPTVEAAIEHLVRDFSKRPLQLQRVRSEKLQKSSQSLVSESAFMTMEDFEASKAFELGGISERTEERGSQETKISENV